MGVGVGLAAFLLLNRTLRTIVFGVGTLDVATLATACATLLVGAGIASFLPAWRAAHVDPAIVLRED